VSRDRYTGSAAELIGDDAVLRHQAAKLGRKAGRLRCSGRRGLDGVSPALRLRAIRLRRLGSSQGCWTKGNPQSHARCSRRQFEEGFLIRGLRVSGMSPVADPTSHTNGRYWHLTDVRADRYFGRNRGKNGHAAGKREPTRMTQRRHRWLDTHLGNDHKVAQN